MDGLSTLGPDSGSFRLEYYTAAELVSALNSGKLVYLSKNPVQKWANDKRTQFIQSILFGLPQCEIMIDGSEQREIIFAGESQLHAIESFIGGRWRMKHAISSDASDREVGYNDLTLAAKLKIKNFKFSAIMINPGVSVERRVWIYYSQLSQKRWESMADSRLGDKHGHLTAFRLQQALTPPEDVAVPELKFVESSLVHLNVNAWTNYIMNAQVGIVPDGDKDASIISLRYEQQLEDVTLSMSPLNMAFGYSYILPIILGILTAPKGSLFIVENPEAHLHPSAQTRMGEFLARAAEAGIQIITETHSDHLLNGVRVAVKKQLAAASHIAIHYIYKDEDNKHHRDRDIKLQADGTLNDWPTGFFDEWEKALGQLL